MKNVYILVILAFLVFGCSLFDDKANNDNTNANASENAENSEKTDENANEDSNEDADEDKNDDANEDDKDSAPVAKKPVIDNSPKRIRFNKGATWGAANTTLPPNRSQKFIVNAKNGQTIDVDVSSKATSVRIVGGKVQVMGDRGGFLRGNILSNGDVTIEVKNTSQKQQKTSVKVTIETPEDEFDLPEHGGDGEDDPE